MAVCLDYQAVYSAQKGILVSVPVQIGAAILLLMALSFKIWVKYETTGLGYQLAKERQATVAYDMERRELELHLSILKRPDRLAATATQKLGLQPHSSSRFKRVGLE